MRKAMAAGLAVLVLAGCGPAKQGAEDGFDTKFHENFVSSCVSTAVKSGASRDAATNLCQCASDKVKERYSSQQKMSLNNQQILPIVEECRSAYRPA